MGFENATPIQDQAIPAVLTGKDVLGGAKTGSGKTVAFLAPTIQRLVNKEVDMAIVLSPTRELVLQMDEEAEKMLRDQDDVNCVPCFGGVPVDTQVIAIKHHKPRLIIGTPGRIIDLFDEHILKPGDFEVCILDEADRMCDMGFTPQVNRIMGDLTNLKQTLLFSATLEKDLNEIIKKYTKDPITIQVDNPEEASDTIEHNAIICHPRAKMKHLTKILNEPNSTTIVFSQTRRGADQIYNEISRDMEGVAVLHAGFTMPERERTIRAFKAEKIRVLIATDVVSRGIDVSHVTHVVHFDLPRSFEDYIHRSGRSGRAGKSGTTIALVESTNREHKRLMDEFSKKVIFNIEEDSGTGAGGQRSRSGQHKPRNSRPQEGGRPHQRGGSREASPRKHGGPKKHSSSKRKPRRQDTANKGKAAAKPDPNRKKARIIPKKKSLLSKIKKVLKRKKRT
jgi:ATP-dependent RNA helicase DeaD